jgi:hypothetical protein
MSVFERILKEIHEGQILYTPVRNKAFTVKSLKTEKIVFTVGKKKTKIIVPKDCWNGIPIFLNGKDWVKIGAKHESTEHVLFGTLERCLDECPDKNSESAGSYVASVLEYLKIVEVDPKRPSKIRLLKSY